MPITPDQHTDPIFLGIGIAICLVVAALFFKHERELKMKRKREQASKPHDNLETLSKHIIDQIKSCWDEDVLNYWLGIIWRFEVDHYGKWNVDYYVSKLKNTYEQQKTDIYREQLRADEVLREMKMI